tara:strand:+ start:988 stop:1236 length:249 start_codon:yes stop_codon:yes gene_type:complete
MMKNIPEDINKLSFENALAELEEIVDSLESGSVDLEKSIEYYTRGSLLKLHCQKKLDEAVLKLEEIKVSSDGKVLKKKANDT